MVDTNHDEAAQTQNKHTDSAIEAQLTSAHGSEDDAQAVVANATAATNDEAAAGAVTTTTTTTSSNGAAAANTAEATEANADCAHQRSGHHPHEGDEQPKTFELKGGYRRLVMLAGAASVTTAILLIVMKFVVWLFSGSATILASLTDSMIDLGASCINLLALRYALMPPDREHRFGHYKAEALASLSQAAFISGSAVLLVINGYDRIVKPHPVGYIDIAIYVSIASIVLTVMLTLFQGYVCKVTHSEAIAADRFHYISDVGLNLTVILSLILSKLGYEWADGLMAILLGLYILKSSWHIGHTAIGTLLDKSMSQEENNKIIQTILSVDGVESFHDLRTRKAGPQNYIQCHLVLDANITLERAHNIADVVESRLSKLFSEVDINLHMEPNDTKTYTNITFFDHLYCPLPDNFYTRQSEEHESLEDIAAQRAAQAAKAAEIASQAARAAAEAANEIAHIVRRTDATENSTQDAKATEFASLDEATTSKADVPGTAASGSGAPQA